MAMMNMRKHWYQFAVQGERNLTLVGGQHFDTVQQAMDAVDAANKQRVKDGRKPIVAIKKVHRNGRSELARFIFDDDDEE